MARDGKECAGTTRDVWDDSDAYGRVTGMTGMTGDD